MVGFVRHSQKLVREELMFRRLRRILHNCGHDLHRCPPDSPDFAERGAYYATTESGEIAPRVDLACWLGLLGDPSTPVWRVDLLISLHTPSSGVVPLEGKPGYYQKVRESSWV